MKLNSLFAISGLVILFAACGKHQASLSIVNSESFNESQILLGESLTQRLLADSSSTIQASTPEFRKLDEINSKIKILKETNLDSDWMAIKKNWADFGNSKAVTSADTSANSVLMLQKWAELNIRLLKLTSEVSFGDALENLIYRSTPVLSEGLIKTIIYTHIYDQIFINLIGSSTLTHYHTTGGTVRLIQETDFPLSNEMILKCETDDVRYLDVFIRIPFWAVNPTVTHGNVKYVAHPGEYCQISRKWNDGDLIRVVLKN
jgi:hypothetical protein